MTILEFIDRHPVWSFLVLFLILATLENVVTNVMKAMSR